MTSRPCKRHSSAILWREGRVRLFCFSFCVAAGPRYVQVCPVGSPHTEDVNDEPRVVSIVGRRRGGGGYWLQGRFCPNQVIWRFTRKEKIYIACLPSPAGCFFTNGRIWKCCGLWVAEMHKGLETGREREEVLDKELLSQSAEFGGATQCPP